MYKLGEYPIVAKFPDDIAAFSITFYGATGIGNAYITLYKSDGTKISEHVLGNVNNGPYGFASPEVNIAGFSLWNDDVGGLSIYEIRYGTSVAAVTYFEDTFTG